MADETAEAAAGSAFLARHGHRMRTQLQTMLGYAHLLARDPAVQLSASAASRVARLDAAARELLTLVDGSLSGGATKDPAAPCAPAPAAPPQAGPRIVVYVEDNAVNAEMMVALLEARAPLRVEIAADGASGIETVRRLRPALLLLDLQLPDIDGFEVWRRLREDPACADLPCLAVSANAGEAETRAARDAGMTGLLAKPVEADRLLESIDRLIPGLTVVE
ncbi:MAG: response regulator [Comamonadaceae bacterium]|nr:response regulator [Comamonadaceae bacterium]